eukprot:3571253-Prymnesium_polylepis.2
MRSRHGWLSRCARAAGARELGHAASRYVRVLGSLSCDSARESESCNWDTVEYRASWCSRRREERLQLFALSPLSAVAR